MTLAVEGIALLLHAAGAGTYSPDAALPDGALPITIAAWPDEHDAAIVVTTYSGGPEPDSRNGWEYPRLQVKVRDHNPLMALDMDRACYDALQEASDDPWLQDCYALQSEPQPLGQDSQGRHEYVRNYQLSTNTTPKE